MTDEEMSRGRRCCRCDYATKDGAGYFCARWNGRTNGPDDWCVCYKQKQEGEKEHEWRTNQTIFRPRSDRRGKSMKDCREIRGKNKEGYPDPTATTALANIAREERRVKGLQSRIEGERFEKIIQTSLEWYHDKGVAYVEKTPEPMRPLSPPNDRGQFKACFVKAAQPDFKGTLIGGRAIEFEAKHTGDDRIEYSRLTAEQVDSLTDHHKLGAATYVVVSFKLQNFYRIPWAVWRDMKQLYGRKYIKETELERYRVKFISGVIKLLDGIETTLAEMEATK